MTPSTHEPILEDSTVDSAVKPAPAEGAEDGAEAAIVASDAGGPLDGVVPASAPDGAGAGGGGEEAVPEGPPKRKRSSSPKNAKGADIRSANGIPTLSMADVHSAARDARALLEPLWARVRRGRPPAGQTSSSGLCIPSAVLLRRLLAAAFPGSWRVAGGSPFVKDGTSFRPGEPRPMDGGTIDKLGARRDHRWVVDDVSGVLVDVSADQFGHEGIIVSHSEDRRYRESHPNLDSSVGGTPRGLRALAHPDVAAALARLRVVAVGNKEPRSTLLLEDRDGGSLHLDLVDGRVLELNSQNRIVSVDGKVLEPTERFSCTVSEFLVAKDAREDAAELVALHMGFCRVEIEAVMEEGGDASADVETSV